MVYASSHELLRPSGLGPPIQKKDKVIAEHKKLKAEGKYDAETIEKMINRKLKLSFHNTIEFTFQRVLKAESTWRTTT